MLFDNHGFANSSNVTCLELRQLKRSISISLQLQNNRCMETWITNGVAKVSTGSIKEANKEEEVSRSFGNTNLVQ